MGTEGMAIEELMREAIVAEEPGSTQTGEKISSSGGLEMVATELKSAGWVYVYDRVTGDRSICNRNMLPAQLRKKKEDGSFAFTTVPVKSTVKKGTLKCLLHVDNPNRAHYDDLGLPTCRKANLTSPFQVQRHMAKRHKVELATIEQEKLAIEKEENREFQRGLLSQIKPQEIPKAPLYVKEK